METSVISLGKFKMWHICRIADGILRYSNLQAVYYELLEISLSHILLSAGTSWSRRSSEKFSHVQDYKIAPISPARPVWRISWPYSHKVTLTFSHTKLLSRCKKIKIFYSHTNNPERNNVMNSDCIIFNWLSWKVSEDILDPRSSFA